MHQWLFCYSPTITIKKISKNMMKTTMAEVIHIDFGGMTRS